MPGLNSPPGKSKPIFANVGIAPAVDDHVVPGLVRESGKIDVDDERPIGLTTSDQTSALCNEQFTAQKADQGDTRGLVQ